MNHIHVISNNNNNSFPVEMYQISVSLSGCLLLNNNTALKPILINTNVIKWMILACFKKNKQTKNAQSKLLSLTCCVVCGCFLIV